MRKNVTRTYRTTVHSQSGLRALLGQPTSSVWETQVTHHTARLWLVERWEDESGAVIVDNHWEKEKQFTVEEYGDRAQDAALKWVAKQLKDATQN